MLLGFTESNWRSGTYECKNTKPNMPESKPLMKSSADLRHLLLTNEGSTRATDVRHVDVNCSINPNLFLG